jgi:hypothetical protein
MSPRADVDTVMKRKIPSPYEDSNPVLTRSLYTNIWYLICTVFSLHCFVWLSYPEATEGTNSINSRIGLLSQGLWLVATLGEGNASGLPLPIKC